MESPVLGSPDNPVHGEPAWGDLPQRPAALSHILTLTTIVGTAFSVLRAKGALTVKEIEAILNGAERVLPEMDKEHGREVIEHVGRITKRLATSST